jgi:predicted Zn-dependent peptidase
MRRRAVYETRTTEQVHLVWGCDTIDRNHPDRYALMVMSTLFGGGMSSRLFQEVREKRGLVYSIFSGQQLHAERGMFAVYAGTSETNAAEVMGIVRREAASVASGAVDAAEVERAKGQVKGSLVLSMDDPGGRMSRLGKAELVHGEVLSVDELLAEIEAVSAEDVIRVASGMFAGEFVLACIGPVADGALDFCVEAV